MEKLKVRTHQKEQLIEITYQVQEVVRRKGVKSGVVIVYVPHTTAGLTINENADSDVVQDLLMIMKELVPAHKGYQHMEGNSDAHMKASLMGSSVTVIVEQGQLQLGTWQGIYFCEFDGPRERSVYVKAI